MLHNAKVAGSASPSDNTALQSETNNHQTPVLTIIIFFGFFSDREWLEAGILFAVVGISSEIFSCLARVKV
jgi:hypothetical protein